jgi:mRNA interferase MazF
MPTDCTLNFDHVGVVHRSRLGAVITTLDDARWPDVQRALLLACGFTVDDAQ